MRELFYAVEGKKANLHTFAIDQPGHGGACYKYRIQESSDPIPMQGIWQDIVFQHGPTAEAGPNGIQMEDLLAICIDRLKAFQAGEYACDENALALAHLQEAMAELNNRTMERIARGVEGTHQS